ncbi:deaminase [Arthrobacter sp. MYb227]|uniref:nucleoside deaminase n=1 Tax=Arthrobacter sp. MYb227 TaxID=1848601 RepID=UPI000CFAB1D4|nr:deaminase [Arthrobacter sp. MYb227]PQZ93726.1 deaminase [Arthrobacter sp. MYb227]
MGPEDAVRLAIEVAEDGLNAGEMPIGALVLRGDQVVAKDFTHERALGRRIVHADLMAMLEADRSIGFSRSSLPLTLVVNLEPCLMCMGAAITLGVDRVWFGLESPNDGAVELLEQWRPPVEQPFFRRPQEILGGIHRTAVQDQFARYATSSAPAGMREWAHGLSVQPIP